MIGEVLKRDIQFGLYPLGRICYLSAYIEAEGLLEVVVPLVVVATVMLEVVVGCLILDVGVGSECERVFAEAEARIQMSVYLELTQFLS